MVAAAQTHDFRLIDDLSHNLHLSVREVGDVLNIHPRTLQRRQESGRLEEAELLKAQMLEEAFSLATTAFHDEDKARAWLFSELPILEFSRPIDLLNSVRGYERIRALLGQIIFGVY